MRILVFLLLLFVPAGAFAQEVRDHTYTAPDGSTVLVHTIDLPASLTDVWEAFTTAEGLMSWAVPRAWVDFRLGGLWESSYDPSAEAGASDNIRSRYLAFIPLRMITLQAMDAPPGFPHPEVLPELFSVTEFDPLDEARTRITMYGVGYADTPAHRAVRDMFRDANAWSLRMLHRRFTEGPVDWSAVGEAETP